MAGSVDPRLVDFVAREEGFRAKAYTCTAGRWTYGYGFTTKPDGSPVRPGDTISEGQAHVRLEATLARLRAAIDRLVTAAVEPHVLDALTSLTFNIGIQAFTTSTALRKLNADDLVGAAAALKAFHKVTRNGKKEVDKGLVARRAREAALLLEGWELASRPAALAVVAEPIKPLAQSRIMAGGTVAAIGSAVAMAQQVRDVMESARPLLELEPITLAVTAAIALAGAAWSLYARWDDHRKAAA